jgi:hypothetical protein
MGSYVSLDSFATLKGALVKSMPIAAVLWRPNHNLQRVAFTTEGSPYEGAVSLSHAPLFKLLRAVSSFVFHLAPQTLFIPSRSLFQSLPLRNVMRDFGCAHKPAGRIINGGNG